MATLCVYLPKYSMTCLGPPKGLFAYTTQFLEKSLSVKFWSLIPLALNKATNFARNTLLIAFTEKRYLSVLTFFFHFPCLLIPPLGTMQCRCGCRLRFCPQVCKMAIIPSWIPSVLPNWFKVAHAASNRVL